MYNRNSLDLVVSVQLIIVEITGVILLDVLPNNRWDIMVIHLYED